MKIKEVCERTNLTERTVRFYMQKGLISPHGEWRNGREYSDFSEEDVEMLRAIATLRELSFSIDDILTMQRTPGTIPAIVATRRNAARAEHVAAENTYAVLGRLDTDGIESVTALASRAREAAAYRPHPVPPKPPKEVNTSGMGDRCTHVPFEIASKWNWGAFLFPVIWGLANHVYQALWCFVPIVGIFYSFYLGSKGNAFAWKYRYWESVEHFRKVQRRWALWTGGITIALIALNIGLTISENRAAERVDAIHAARLAALEESIRTTPEVLALLDGRTEWTLEMQRESWADYKDTADELDICVFNSSDMFYFAPDAYYQMTMSTYYDHDEGENATITDAGEIVFDNPESARAEYVCRLELSNGEVWLVDGVAGGDAQFTSVKLTQDTERTTKNQNYWAAVRQAGDVLREYVTERTEEITGSTLWLETIGPEYEFTVAPQPAYINYEQVYTGGDVLFGGFFARVKAADGTLYDVSVETRHEGTAEEIELPLAIKPVAGE